MSKIVDVIGEYKGQFYWVRVASFPEQFVAVYVVPIGESAKEGEPPLESGPALASIVDNLNGVLAPVVALDLDIKEDQDGLVLVEIDEYAPVGGILRELVGLVEVAVIVADCDGVVADGGDEVQIEPAGREVPVLVDLPLFWRLPVHRHVEQSDYGLLNLHHDVGDHWVRVVVV